MEPCVTCDEATKSKRAKERSGLINLVAETYKNTPFIKLAIVETINGKLGIREKDDESITRKIKPLRIVEYLYLLQGIAAR